MTTLEKQGAVFVLDLGDGDNRFNADSVAEINAALDEVEAVTGPAALVTIASGKIWHNGLDLDFMGTLDDDWMPFVGAVQKVFARMLTLPTPTVAAIQGHVFAAGAMFSLAHDIRLMREDRGYFCLPEIDLGLSFSEGFAALIAAKLPQPGLHRLAVLGERLPGPTAVDVGAIDLVVPEEAVLPEAIALAELLSPKAGSALRALRLNFYSDVVASLLPDG